MIATAIAQQEKECLYRLALSRIPGIGIAQTKKLTAIFGNTENILGASRPALLSAGLPDTAAGAILDFRGQKQLEDELKRLEREHIRLLYFTDPDYPQRFLSLPDIPPILFYRGNASLNAKKIVAVIGTRAADEYGKRVTAQLLGQMVQPDLLVISGLATGIDTAAHSVALAQGLETVGILGHGLGHLYPPENRLLAQAMIKQGGLLTSFERDVKPERYHFPARNRLVAGLCDVLLVVQTGRKGGSLLTVEYARKMGRPVFAVPGRLGDNRNAGCNHLIREGTATLLTSGEQVSAAMGWQWPSNGAGTQSALDFASGTSTANAGPQSQEDKLLGL